MAQHITVSSPGVIAVTPNFLSKHTTKFVPVSNIAGFTIKAFYDRSSLTIHSKVAREDIAVFDNLPNAEIAAIKDVLVNELRDKEADFGQKLDDRLGRMEEWASKMEYGAIRNLLTAVEEMTSDVEEIRGKSHEARMLSTCIDLSLPSSLRKKIHENYSTLNKYNGDYYLDTFGPVIDDSIYSEDRHTETTEQEELKEEERKEEEAKEEELTQEEPKQEQAAVVPVPPEDHWYNIKQFTFLLVTLYYVLTKCPGFCNMRSLA